jgi:hypothetical protein
LRRREDRSGKINKELSVKSLWQGAFRSLPWFVLAPGYDRGWLFWNFVFDEKQIDQAEQDKSC